MPRIRAGSSRNGAGGAVCAHRCLEPESWGPPASPQHPTAGPGHLQLGSGVESRKGAKPGKEAGGVLGGTETPLLCLSFECLLPHLWRWESLPGWGAPPSSFRGRPSALRLPPPSRILPQPPPPSLSPASSPLRPPASPPLRPQPPPLVAETAMGLERVARSCSPSRALPPRRSPRSRRFGLVLRVPRH